MQFDSAIIRIILIFIPGILGRIVFNNLKATKKRNLWEDIIEIFIFAVFAYLLASTTLFAIEKRKVTIEIQYFEEQVQQEKNADLHREIIALKKQKRKELSIFPYNINSVLNDELEISWIELVVACGYSFLLGFLIAAAYNYKILNKVGRLLRVTQSFGDEDLWEHINNSPGVVWVNVRDFKNNLSYNGKITKYSNSYKPRELMLEEVKVYDNLDGNMLEEFSAIYLGLQDNECTIEIKEFADELPDNLTEETYSKCKSMLKGNSELQILRKVYTFDAESGDYKLNNKCRKKLRLKLKKLIYSGIFEEETDEEDKIDE